MLRSVQPHNAISLQEEVDLTRAQNNPHTCQNTCKGMLVQGAIDADRLGEALTYIALLYDALRTHFVSPQKGTFERVVEPSCRVQPQVLVMDSYGPQDTAVIDAVRLFTEKRFEVEEFPLIRLLLVRLNENRSIVVIALAQAITDGYSLNHILTSVDEVYASLGSNSTPAIAPPAYSLADFAYSHRQWMKDDHYRRTIETLRTTYAEAINQLNYPRHMIPDKSWPCEGAGVVKAFAPQTTGNLAIRAAAQRYKLSVPATLLAITLMSFAKERSTGKFFFLRACANRHFKGLDGVLGHLATTMLQFVDAAAMQTIEKFFAATHKGSLAAMFQTGLIPLKIGSTLLREAEQLQGFGKNAVSPSWDDVDVMDASKAEQQFLGNPSQNYPTGYVGHVSNDIKLIWRIFPTEEMRLTLRVPATQMQRAQRVVDTIERAVAYIAARPEDCLGPFMESSQLSELPVANYRMV